MRCKLTLLVPGEMGKICRHIVCFVAVLFSKELLNCCDVVWSSEWLVMIDSCWLHVAAVAITT